MKNKKLLRTKNKIRKKYSKKRYRRRSSQIRKMRLKKTKRRIMKGGM